MWWWWFGVNLRMALVEPSPNQLYVHWLIGSSHLINKHELYSLCPTFFVMFEKSNFLKEYHLLSCLPFKNL